MSTRAWRKRRAGWQHILNLGGELECWRCGGPIQLGDAWDLGHIIDRALGGTDADTAPEHRYCNRSAARPYLRQMYESGRVDSSGRIYYVGRDGRAS